MAKKNVNPNLIGGVVYALVTGVILYLWDIPDDSARGKVLFLTISTIFFLTIMRQLRRWRYP
ncbi:MAG: hypothetical protein U1D30_02425 [Planctomycetota bacterium]